MSKLDLSPFVYTQGDDGEVHTPYLNDYGKPFSVVDVAGKVWNVATNRQWLIAVRSKAVYGPWKGSPAPLNMILNFIQSHEVSPRRVSVIKLQDWASKGQVGILRFSESKRAVVRLDKLTQVLQAHTESYLDVWDASTTAAHQPCIGLAEPDRRMFLMGWHGSILTAVEFDLEVEAEPLEEAPVAEEGPAPELEGQDAFEAMMDLE